MLTNYYNPSPFQQCPHLTPVHPWDSITGWLVKMNDSIREDLIESGESDNDYYLADDDADESHFIHALNTILSGTARLNVLLPTATILAFTIFTPLLTNDGKCDTFSRWLMGFFLVISAASCVFFSITDSFRTATGRLYYGVATFRGISTFNGGRKKPCVPSDYRLRWADLFHTSLSLIAFLTFAASHNDVLECYYHAMPRKVTNSAPLVVGFVISFLFVMFPSRRRGIGYPFLLQRDALYIKGIQVQVQPQGTGTPGGLLLSQVMASLIMGSFWSTSIHM